MLGPAGQPRDPQLTDLHPGPRVIERQVRDVGEFQRDVTAEAGVDEAGSRVGQQPQAPQRRFALQPARPKSSGSVHSSSVEPSTNSPGCSTNGSPLTGSTRLVELVLLLCEVDMRVSGVVEHPEQTVETNVHAGRLDQGVVERVNSQPAGGDFGPEITIGEQHATGICAQARARGVGGQDATPCTTLPKRPRRCCSSMAEHQLPKLNTQVQIPSSAPI